MKSLLSSIGLIALLLLSGCVVKSPPQSINAHPLTRVTVIDENRPFAADPAGRTLAFARGGLQLLDLDSAAKRTLAPEMPLALAWSPDGASLAAVFSHADYEIRLAVYSSQGVLLRDAVLPIALGQMVWSQRGDLLITGFALKIYTFGGDLHQVLYRVSEASIEETVLSDTTLKPATLKYWSSSLKELLPVAFSQDGDELVYFHLHDPPRFPPYLKLRYQNWQVGESRELQRFPLQPLQLAWQRDGRSMSVRSASSVWQLDLWPEPPAVNDSASPSSYHFTDGRLFDGVAVLADWGEGARLQRLADGRFLLAVEKTLYLGAGLRAEEQASYSEKAWALRRWRFAELITAEDAAKLLQEVKP